MCVLFLDEQPWLLFAILARQAHECPKATQLVSFKLKLQLARMIGPGRIAADDPGSPVPYDDFSGTVLPGGNIALELVVGNRMVFNMDSHTLDGRIQTGSFGHGPAFHGAVHFQAKVIVQGDRKSTRLNSSH